MSFILLLWCVKAQGQATLQQFLPKGYVLFDSTEGDLNKDGVADLVLLIKGTNTSAFVVDEHRGKLDRNRRGIIVLLKVNTAYKKVFENRDCFTSEQEDGGVYFPPELSLMINKWNLLVNYAHGRYGYWYYTFRYRDGDLELIGYDESNGGAVVDSEISLNFLTGKKKYKVNTNEKAEGGDEVFKTTWTNIKKRKLFKLSEIKDFHELHSSLVSLYW